MSSRPLAEGKRDALLLSPFYRFYEEADRPLPPITWLVGEELPEPSRSLLFHENDMTPTLADFHREELGLRVLRRHQKEGLLDREVVLIGSKTAKAVEYGAIHILLERLPDAIRSLVEDGKAPLGGILGENKLAHGSEPQGFFQTIADNHIAHALEIEEGLTVFGRCNRLSLLPSAEVFAEIVEILPP